MFWTADEVAVFLTVTKSMVYKLTKHGVLPFYRFGASVRFDPDKVRKWVESCEVKSYELPKVEHSKPRGPRPEDLVDVLISKARRSAYTHSRGRSGSREGG